MLLAQLLQASNCKAPNWLHQQEGGCSYPLKSGGVVAGTQKQRPPCLGCTGETSQSPLKTCPQGHFTPHNCSYFWKKPQKPDTLPLPPLSCLDFWATPSGTWKIGEPLTFKPSRPLLSSTVPGDKAGMQSDQAGKHILRAAEL